MKILIRDNIEWYTYLSVANDEWILYKDITDTTLCVICRQKVNEIAIVIDGGVRCSQHCNITALNEISDGDEVFFGGDSSKIFCSDDPQFVTDGDLCYDCDFPIEKHDVLIYKINDQYNASCIGCIELQSLLPDGIGRPPTEDTSTPIAQALAVVADAKKKAFKKLDAARRATEVIGRAKRIKQEAADMGVDISVIIHPKTRKHYDTVGKYTKLLNMMDKVVGSNRKSICGVCRDKEVTYALACGHSYCKACIDNMENCAVCRSGKGVLRRIYL